MEKNQSNDQYKYRYQLELVRGEYFKEIDY